MAELDYGAMNAPASSLSGSVSKAMNFLGAASSIVLVAGLAVWGYQLSVRDMSAVPVIRALEGPSREQPSDPGGLLARHTGLAVNQVQSEGEAAGPAPQVILAPSPIELTEEDAIDAPVPQLETEVAVSTADISEDPAPEVEAPVLQELSTLSEPNAVLEEEVEEVELARPILDPTIPGVNRSVIPLRKPNPPVRLASASPTAVEAAVASALSSLATAPEVEAATIAPGTRLVQLGVADDRDAAIAEWDKIASSYTDFFEGKSRIIQKATSGGREFYRLRVAGFDDLNSARRFCAALTAGDAACIPVLAR